MNTILRQDGCELYGKEEDEMSQNIYNDLIIRIRTHCQRVAQDALDPKLRWNAGNSPKDPYERWYVHDRKSFIAFKKKRYGQIPWIAFPPATETQILKTEQQLGFALPPLLRLLYTHIANGGFGPGYGIIGAIGGFSFTGSGGKNIVERYRWNLDGCKLVHLEDYEMLTWAQYIKQQRIDQTPKKERNRSFGRAKDSTEKSEWEGIYVYQLPYEVWPERLVTLCDWGCAINTYLDTNTEHIFQGTGDKQHYLLRYVASSLEEWLERWLAGENLQFL
jgi:hypothetical protein